MLKRIFILLGLMILFATGISSMPMVQPANACGGFFCSARTPILQSSEDIIFTVDADLTTTAYVYLGYTGAPNIDFAWVLPVPTEPTVGTIEPDLFDEIENITEPFRDLPVPPNCQPMQDEPITDNDVIDNIEDNPVPITITSRKGPPPNGGEEEIDVIGWLDRENYDYTEEMAELTNSYIDEGMLMLTMESRTASGSSMVEPVKLTYKSDTPMIPLRLTAIAAVPDMPIYVWIFAEEPAYPLNFDIASVDPAQIEFVDGVSNYEALLNEAIDLHDGRAFVLEYAGLTADLLEQQTIEDETLLDLLSQYRYVTRYTGRISPAEMLVDPTFGFDPNLPDVPHPFGIEQPAQNNWGCP